MPEKSSVIITINFNDLGLDLEEQDKNVHLLLNQLKSLDEVITVGRVTDPSIPKDSKSLSSGWIVGLLMAEVNVENFKKLILFLGERLQGKTIELEIEVDGNKLKVKAGSQAGLNAALAASQIFIDTLKTYKLEA
jgi:hypothetical protein